MSSATSWNPMKDRCDKLVVFGDAQTWCRCDSPKGHKGAHGAVGCPNEDGEIVRTDTASEGVK